MKIKLKKKKEEGAPDPPGKVHCGNLFCVLWRIKLYVD